ncbi:cobalamin synthesis protein P47K [Thermobaculum terrenum ATCC BAA-798]|uniref:Cobalamin synthesis protein P47K n=1 Tax=Thermobaculum terrenum (strain ATCC BAA-798 / CCMEE 7001 / YNP1) TaxID=525904 RepID=D1CHZ3_THET1|nr:GTP-binding protein [Thermobaculum terrenum]ACZ43364.1 cobalamin synthesis protein P47K [Thermobaculum terrenum ATCC BAA-798]
MSGRVVLVGGFLGAGKTTLLLRAARQLERRGLKVGVVTNDQGTQLVDTALARGASVPVMEVTGGCFCCRFDELLNALHAELTLGCQVVLAEPVGSCTDLLATVVRPLLRMHPGLEVAPLSVLIDPTKDSSKLPEHIRYLYQQQLEEAELLVINKVDLLSYRAPEVLREVRAAHPASRCVPISALTGESVDAWLELVLGGTTAADRDLALDYDRYAAAEAALGWLNCSGSLSADGPYKLKGWAERVLTSIGQAAQKRGAPVGHLKLYLQVAEAQYRASLLDALPEVQWDSSPGAHEVAASRFVLNARVGLEPDLLAKIAQQTLAAASAASGAKLVVEAVECFAPSPPRPTYRLDVAGRSVLPIYRSTKPTEG